MYNYVKGYVKVNNQWSELNVSLITMANAISDYQDIKLITTYDIETSERIIKFSSNKTLLSLSTKTDTVVLWLANLVENDVVHTTGTTGWNALKSVKVIDHYSLPITLTKGNILYGDGVVIPEGLDKDIKISSSTTLVSDEHHIINIAKNMLFAINGRITSMEYSSGFAYAVDAKFKATGTGDLFSFIDFTDIGGLTQVPLSSTGISSIPRSLQEVASGKTRFIVNTGVDTSNLTPFLVLDGYIHIFDGSVKMIGNGIVLLTVDHTLAIKRSVDLTSGIHTYIDAANIGEEGVDPQSFRVQEYLNQTDSFIAFVHSTEICLLEERLQLTGNVGGYEFYRVPKGMLFDDLGRLVPYWISEASENQVGISVGDNIKHNLLSDTKAFSDWEGYDNSSRSSPVLELHQAIVKELYIF